jgi:hypothetical protein
MRRDITEPTRDERGDETHPAWGLISVHRGSYGPPGAVLFDSDIRHQFALSVRIAAASRQRDLNRDWLHREREFIEIAMSEAQWASFVSSMNTGNGVPCTITYRHDEGMVPGFPYEPRLAESTAEVERAADRSLAEIRAAFEAYTEHKTAANLRNLRARIENAGPNMRFAAESLTEHAENVVQKARADIEAMVVAKAQQLGVGVEELAALPGEAPALAAYSTPPTDANEEPISTSS